VDPGPVFPTAAFPMASLALAFQPTENQPRIV
jgi:hypothetical protein